MAHLTPGLPDGEEGWNMLAAGIIRANMAIAGMNFVRLERSLRELDVFVSAHNTSVRVGKAKFTAAFFLQMLVATGAEILNLPTPDDFGARLLARAGTIDPGGGHRILAEAQD